MTETHAAGGAAGAAAAEGAAGGATCKTTPGTVAGTSWTTFAVSSGSRSDTLLMSSSSTSEAGSARASISWELGTSPHDQKQQCTGKCDSPPQVATRSTSTELYVRALPARALVSIDLQRSELAARTRERSKKERLKVKKEQSCMACILSEAAIR